MNVAPIIFYTKPGCSGGARQKALLEQSGHTVEERSIFAEEWTPDKLLAFFGDSPVEEWFNRNAPAVKSGLVVPGSLSREETLKLLGDNPLLIKRPLMQIGERKTAGFEQDRLREWIGLVEIPGYNTECHSHSASPDCAGSGRGRAEG